MSFENDEDNNTAALTPSAANGYIGCFMDRKETRKRDLIGNFDLSGSSGDIEKCRKSCQNYFYFGLQLGLECFCGNEFGEYGRVSESHCDYKCKRSNQICGGLGKNSVYRVKPYQATFQGCFKPDILHKEITVVKKVATDTVDNCIHACARSPFGLGGGDTCYCIGVGHNVRLDKMLETSTFRVSDWECNTRCRGYHGQVCGGDNGKIAVYFPLS